MKKGSKARAQKNIFKSNSLTRLVAPGYPGCERCLLEPSVGCCAAEEAGLKKKRREGGDMVAGMVEFAVPSKPEDLLNGESGIHVEEIFSMSTSI